MAEDLGQMLEFAVGLARETGPLIRTAWLRGAEASYKTDGSTLTETDCAVEALWRARINARFPEHAILGEEFGAEKRPGAYCWVLDPIDGTRQFATGLANFASLISLCHGGEPILGIIDLPLIGVRYSAARGQGAYLDGRPIRVQPASGLKTARIGLANPESFAPTQRPSYEALAALGRVRSYDGGALAYGAVACGQLDLCLNGADLDAFDICALVPVVSEAGGCLTDWSGAPVGLESRGAIIASASLGLHEAALTLLGGG